MIEPLQFDLHAAAELARFLGRSPLLDHCVQSAIHHHLLGGIPFAGAVFYFWVQAEHENRPERLGRLITILLGSLAAIALALWAGEVISWLPPQHQPGLARLYPKYLIWDDNTNSFPSDSTAVYTAISVGLISLNRRAGAMLLAAVLLLVSLPRMYVGGHYPTDVLAGLLIGLAGYAIARVAFDPKISGQIVSAGSRPGWRRVVLEACVFLWIVEVAVNFQEGLWIVHALAYFHVRLPG